MHTSNNPGTLADIYITGAFFMKINLMPASLNLVTWSEHIKIQDKYHYQTDSISNTLYDIIHTYNPNVIPLSYIIRISNKVIPNFNMETSWICLYNNYNTESIAINVVLNVKRLLKDNYSDIENDDSVNIQANCESDYSDNSDNDNINYKNKNNAQGDYSDYSD